MRALGTTLLVAALALAGCSAPLVSLKQGAREYVPNDYGSVLDRWTREADLFSFAELENFLAVTATHLSWDFTWAYVIRYGNDYRLTVEQRQALLDRSLEETKQRHEFYVTVAGGNRREADLSKPNTAWIVRLIDDTGNETAPQDIALIRRPTILEKTYFPFTTIYRQTYRIRFPVEALGRRTISEKARWFGLRFAGVQGSSELKWELEKRR